MRLIDADALKIPSTSVDIFENCRNCRLLDEEQVREIIDNAPTIDAVEIKHGHWTQWHDESDRLFFRERYRCSVCEADNTYGKSDYCPWCGAKMDGDK